MISDTSHLIGRAAEHFVCYELSRRGIRASLSPFEQAPYDILAEYKGQIITIQVKGTAKPQRPSGYRFTFTKPVKADLIAFVALDTETVHYKKVEDHKKAIWIPKTKMCVTTDYDLLELCGLHQKFTKEKRATSL